MNNLLETVSASSKLAKAIAGLVFWALVMWLLITVCSDQASHRERGLRPHRLPRHSPEPLCCCWSAE